VGKNGQPWGRKWNQGFFVGQEKLPLRGKKKNTKIGGERETLTLPAGKKTFLRWGKQSINLRNVVGRYLGGNG